jgi:predicted dehydrogenase
MTSKPRKLKIGLIGCGKVAFEHHLPSLKRIARAEIVAVADRQIDRLVRLTKDYPTVTQYTTAAELLQDPRVEAVGVLTHTPSHHEIGLAALQAGKHVFLEKPLALSRIECDRLVEAGRVSGNKTMVCFNLRWHRLIRQAKQIVSSGRLGSIVAIRSVYTHFRDGKDAPDWHRKLCHGGGVTFNESVHHIDLWRYLLRQEIEDIFAFHTPSATYEDETSVINARLSGGTLATAINTFQTSPTSELEIYGSRGRLALCLYRFDGLRFYSSSEYPGSFSTRMKAIPKAMTQLAGACPAMKRGGGFGETFYHAWSHFIDSIIADKHPDCSFDDGRQAVLASLAAIQSFQTNQLVAVAGDNRLPCQ